MPRTDLLALSPDDLAAITNRGAVKRAERELKAGTPAFEIADTPGGELVVKWSDGITCRFPPGKPLHDAVCSSGVAGISRHVVRSVPWPTRSTARQRMPGLRQPRLGRPRRQPPPPRHGTPVLFPMTS